MFKESLSYDDVLLEPQYSDIRSRSQIDISTVLGGKFPEISIEMPIFSSPMDTITEDSMAIVMAGEGGAGIIHRYNTIEEQIQLIKNCNPSEALVGAAVGITGDYVERACGAVVAGASFICLDVAHGHHILMKEALTVLREYIPTTHIMAGNVATLKGINDLADWGANSVRCNIGGGSICSTRIQTGHGMPGFQTILECAKTDRDVGIIADGGIRNAGDIVKALAAGADAVMCGSIFAGTAETPGKIFTENGATWKTYRGMASKEAQFDWKGKYSSFEGVSSKVPYRGHVDLVLRDLKRNIKSGFSYSGARNIAELRSKAKFIKQTSAGTKESGTHINSRKW